MKKLLSILLSALICFSSLTGLTVFAEETEPATKPDTQPTTTEQITATTTPKSTIPGGAYVTYNLTNVISSNMQEEVWGYYETTLSPVQGYKINYISVKQGDKDMPVIDNGDGTYTFKNEGGFTDNLTITVKAKSFPIKLSVTDMNLYVGSSSVIDVIDGTAIEWKSSDEKVATVKNGKVTAVGKGTATITVTLSTYDYLRCNVTVLEYDAPEKPLPSESQEFCDAVNQYIIDCGMENYFLFKPDADGNKVMFTPETFKSQEVYLETTDFAIFNLHGVMPLSSQETIGDYTFHYNVTFDSSNPCGFCVYNNGKVYGIKDAVDKGMTDVHTLASVIPGTTKDGVPVTVNKNENAKVNHLYDSADCSSNKATTCKIGSRYTTILEAKPYMNTEYTITNVDVLMGKDTFIAPKRVNDNKVIIDIPYVTGDITIGVLTNTKLYPTVGETLGCFATNMENVSYYRCYSDGIDDILLENQIFECAVAPYSYKVVPDEGYEIVSFTPKTVSLNRDTGEYTFDECSFEKTDNNEYLVKEWGNVKFEGEVRKIESKAKLSESKLTLKAGDTKTLKVTDGTAKAWATSNKNVATVNNGKVTAVGKGTATITATLTTGEKLTCKVTVSGMHAHPSVGYPTNITVNVGSKIGWDPYLGKWANCVSSNKNVATVNSNKVIKGISKGKAVISIKAKCGCTAKCTVTVKQPVTKIKLSLTKKTLKVKESCKIKAVATPGNANNSQIKWTTSNKKVACVTKEKTKSKGWNCIKAKKKGSAVIKAKAVDGSKTSAICKVTVK
ncbi:MAG: Ig-like domain-containing protein [Ruminococcus sp.]|nr:Ig-like domain-containing protein [Ruminococcus sp.]